MFNLFSGRTWRTLVQWIKNTLSSEKKTEEASQLDSTSSEATERPPSTQSPIDYPGPPEENLGTLRARRPYSGATGSNDTLDSLERSEVQRPRETRDLQALGTRVVRPKNHPEICSSRPSTSNTTPSSTVGQKNNKPKQE